MYNKWSKILGGEKMNIIFDMSKDPYFNLACEEYLLAADHFSGPVVCIWQNDPAIIVGKFQNTPAEINDEYVKNHDIAVVRRITGGGAVYHDEGNINYTIVQKASSKIIDFDQFTAPIISLLQKYGIEAQNKGRNDIEAYGSKISGGAQTIIKGRVLHHGTLLYDVKLDVLSKALNPKAEKLSAKGVRSVRARVANICEFMPQPVTPFEFMHKLKDFFLSQKNASEYCFTAKDLAAIRKLTDEKYSLWEWNYGASPDFDTQSTARYTWGELTIYLATKDDYITNIKLYGDFFTTHDVDAKFRKLIGTKLEEKSLSDKIDTENILMALPELAKEELIKQLMCR